MVQGLQAIRKLGRMVVFGVFGNPATVDWSIIGDRKELDIRGAHLGPYCYPTAIDWLNEGVVDADAIVTHRLPLGDFQAGAGRRRRGDQGHAGASEPRGVNSGPPFVGVDVGTTAAKAVLTDDAAPILGEHQAGYDVLTPKPLWAEQWPGVLLERRTHHRPTRLCRHVGSPMRSGGFTVTIVIAPARSISRSMTGN